MRVRGSERASSKEKSLLGSSVKINFLLEKEHSVSKFLLRGLLGEDESCHPDIAKIKEKTKDEKRKILVSFYFTRGLGAISLVYCPSCRGG